jgi:hypothetical protein
VSQLEKLIAAIEKNPKDVRFDDACKVAEKLGFRRGGKSATSHCAYSRPNEQTGLNFQNRNGKIPPYQARQLIEMIERYREEL